MTPTLAAIITFAVHLGAAQLAAGTEPPEPEVPKGTVEAAPSSSGSTEVEGQGKFAAADVDARKAEDATELEISAGGLYSTGNAYAAAVTGQGRFRLRRGRHQVASQVAANYGRADVTRALPRWNFVPPPLDDPGAPARAVYTDETEDVRDTTVTNIQGMARYDVYFAKRWSAFLMATLRRDRFQGLDLRFNLDPGVAFHVLTNAKHRLWFEAGYDFQYDAYREDSLYELRPLDPAVDEDGDGYADTDRFRIIESEDDFLVNHAARLFAGYNNSLSQRVSLDTQLEYLQSVIEARRYRLNWISALTIQLANRLGLSATFTLRYENDPLPTVEKLDTITAVLLTVRFL
ncbi:DUF481 domain-containing protein [Paraliomyxa miuraensis]|uniref:DUF481 domain-containing protein n=1 Tax=Paraliomyxa miuraensis TaxID=376150 RepID=UPI00225B3692|nr:DUF481 domain-containing protein [Paraliomyxa miuraensis]MCX4246663.1 DUF481 domain-containing protein [Paraliomyxa miuraensis]